MHEFLSITPLKKKECGSCQTKIELICKKCGNCRGCHFRQEQEEKFAFRSTMPNPSKSYQLLDTSSFRSQSARYREKKSSVLTNIFKDKKVVDVFGEEKEPICNYLRCRHRFSLHGLKAHKKICTCKHPQNSIIGVAREYIWCNNRSTPAIT